MNADTHKKKRQLEWEQALAKKTKKSSEESNVKHPKTATSSKIPTLYEQLTEQKQLTKEVLENEIKPSNFVGNILNEHDLAFLQEYSKTKERLETKRKKNESEALAVFEASVKEVMEKEIVLSAFTTKKQINRSTQDTSHSNMTPFKASLSKQKEIVKKSVVTSKRS